MGIRRRLTLALLLTLAGASAAYADAHETNAAGQNLPQNYVSHADFLITGNAAPVQVLGTNSNRVEVLCCDISNTNVWRVGDAGVASNAGQQVVPNVLGGPSCVQVPITGPVYVFSTAGATGNCGEVVRP